MTDSGRRAAESRNPVLCGEGKQSIDKDLGENYFNSLPLSWKKIGDHTKCSTWMSDRSFINNCPNLEANMMSFSEWISKLWYIQTMK